MNRNAYVISDLHLGAGQDDPLEDFRDDVVLSRWVRAIANDRTTLFINGDFIDFAQIPPFDVPAPNHLLWNEQASLSKLERALHAHQESFSGLAGFIEAGGHLCIIAGNHDLDLAWPRVQQRLRQALGDPPHEQFRVVIGNENFGGVLIEHGYQFTPENCPRNPTQFIHDWEGDRYLERVWGTDFMLQFYNELERAHPYADNVKPMLSVVYHGLRTGLIGGSELVRVLLFLKQRGVPWAGMASSMLTDTADLKPAQLMASFEEPAWREVIHDRLHDQKFVADAINAYESLSPRERHIVSDQERLTLDVQTELGNGGGPTLGLFREDREWRAARVHLSRNGVTHVVFGHTHAVVDGHLLTGDLKGRLFNPGCWIPQLDMRDANVVEKMRTQGFTKELLSDARLYMIDRRAVHIQLDDHYAATVALIPAS